MRGTPPANRQPAGRPYLGIGFENGGVWQQRSGRQARVRVWVTRFGPLLTRCLRRRRGPPSSRWHLDKMFVKIAGWQMYLWRAVDREGEVPDMLVQRRRDKHAARG